MGTVVLLPHDCLTSFRSRHKHHISDTIYFSESAARARIYTLQALDLRNAPSSLYPDQSREKFNSARTIDRSTGAGLLPLPGHGPHSLPINITWKGGEAKKSLVRKPAEQGVGNSLSKLAYDVPVLPILQRPKHKKAHYKVDDKGGWCCQGSE